MVRNIELQQQRWEAKTNIDKQVSNSRCMNYHTPPRLHLFVDAALFAAVLVLRSFITRCRRCETFNSSSNKRRYRTSDGIQGINEISIDYSSIKTSPDGINELSNYWREINVAKCELFDNYLIK